MRLKQALLALGCPKVAVSDLARDDMPEAVEDAFRYGTLVLAKSPDGQAEGLRRLVDASLIPESAETRARREDAERIMKRLFDE